MITARGRPDPAWPRLAFRRAMTVEPAEIEAKEGASARSGGRRSWPTRARHVVSDAPAGWSLIALALLLIVGGVVLAAQTRGTTFWADDWSWIIGRRSGSLDAYLQPHNQHFSLVPVAIYKLLFATVGLRHYIAFRAVLIGCDLACATLVFVYVRRRLGGYLGLLATALILFFGPGWQDILWSFQIGWLISVGSGIGALLVLERRDRAGDIAASLLLMVALASSGVGLAVAVGVAVDVLQRRRRRDWWIVLVPAALYALWWLAYQQTKLDPHALPLVPQFVFNAATGVLSSLTGLAKVNVVQDTGTFQTWGVPLLLLALVAGAWRLRRVPPRPRVLSVGAILIAFWIITGVGRAYAKTAALPILGTGDESRYLYVGAVFVVLLISDVLDGWRPSPVVAAAALVVVGLAVLANTTSFRDATRLLRSEAAYTAGAIDTLNLSRPIVGANYVSNGFLFVHMTAERWFAIQRDLGAPVADRPLKSLPENVREAADDQLARIQVLGLNGTTLAAGKLTGAAPRVDSTPGGIAPTRGGCVLFRPAVYSTVGGQRALAVTVPPGGLLLRAGSSALVVSTRRFARLFRPLGDLAPSASATFEPKRDLSAMPWHLQVASDASFSVCALH